MRESVFPYRGNKDVDIILIKAGSQHVSNLKINSFWEGGVDGFDLEIILVGCTKRDLVDAFLHQNIA